MADPRPELEMLLADALRPIEPPEDLAGRVEDMLSAVTEAAASELSEWADELSSGELAALRDPRNWVRPVIAVHPVIPVLVTGINRGTRARAPGTYTSRPKDWPMSG